MPRFDIWFRNPRYYWEQLQDEGVRSICFDQAYCSKRRIDPLVWMRTHFGRNEQWRVLRVGSYTAPMWTDLSGDQPAAVWPVWSAVSDTWNGLEKLADSPISERPEQMLLDRINRPVPGQDHVIVVTDLPNAQELAGKQFFRDLSEFQEEHMDCTLYLHGLYSFATLFGLEFQMGDHESREWAANKIVALPGGGKLMDISKMRETPFWADLMGFKVRELETSPDARCRFNIRSAVWAATYFKRYTKFGFGQRGAANDPEIHKKILESKSIYTRRLVARPGDRVVCDDCSLWLACKYYREGDVCIVGGTSTKKIADLFGTRSTENITTGLTKLMALQLDRVDAAREHEDATIDEDGLDPNLTKLIDSIFKNGLELLAITDPAFRKGAAGKVQLNISGQTVQVDEEDAKKQLVQDAVKAIEASGTARKDITAAMVQDYVRQHFGEQKARELEA